MFANGVLTTTDCGNAARSGALMGMRPAPGQEDAVAAAAAQVKGYMLSSEHMGKFALQMASRGMEL